MTMSKTKVRVIALATGILSSTALATAAFSESTYGPFPVTLKGYSGSKTNSVSYTGQIARHVLHAKHAGQFDLCRKPNLFCFHCNLSK